MQLRTKYEHWKYEDEVRMFVDLADQQKEGDLYFHYPTDAIQLREVILGPLCDLTVDEVFGLLEGSYADVAVIKIDPKDIENVNVVMTIMDGRIVFEK